MVLEDINLKVRRGRTVALVGESGSGKTTLFHIIMGLLKPLSGKVEIFGRPVREEKDFIDIRRRVGLLFQDADDQLFSPTVREDVAFGPANFGVAGESLDRRVDAALEVVSGSEFADRPPHHLSGGEKRRASLATVLSMEPEVLVFDVV
mgnify:CR=1 FL=1